MSEADSARDRFSQVNTVSKAAEAAARAIAKQTVEHIDAVHTTKTERAVIRTRVASLLSRCPSPERDTVRLTRADMETIAEGYFGGDPDVLEQCEGIIREALSCCPSPERKR